MQVDYPVSAIVLRSEKQQNLVPGKSPHGRTFFYDKGADPLFRKAARKTFVTTAVLVIFFTLTGCKSKDIFFSVQNKSGETLHDIKVTYPGGELTIDSLTDSTINGSFGYFDGPGRLSVSYITEGGGTHSSSGPQVNGNEKGQLNVTLDGSSASFGKRSSRRAGGRVSTLLLMLQAKLHCPTGLNQCCPSARVPPTRSDLQ